jgi:glycosyltransferase involved in cell wall biosynthesis
MTLISKLVFPIEKKKTLQPPRIEIHNISIVIPVKDNQRGINNFLDSFFETQKREYYPKEIIIIDNNSKVPIQIKSTYRNRGIDIILEVCTKKGPGVSRNLGVKLATESWIFFLDSDCLLTENSILGYIQNQNGSIAYAGNVKSLDFDFISKYYETQEILLPMKIIDENGNPKPQYLITANCLVWKNAFTKAGGFNEKIQIAGGEDVDLGLRLSQIGNLSYSFDAIVKHNFDDGLIGFCKRFVRYGKGNKIVEKLYHTDLSPKLFRPNKKTFINEILAKLQWLFLKIGYTKN